MSRAGLLRVGVVSALSLGLFAPPSHAGFGLGSPTDLWPGPGDLVLLDAKGEVAEVEVLASGKVEWVEGFALSELDSLTEEQLAGAKVYLYDVQVTYRRGPGVYTVWYPEVEVTVDADCRAFQGRVVPGYLVDPDGVGVVNLGVLHGWMATAPCL